MFRLGGQQRWYGDRYDHYVFLREYGMVRADDAAEWCYRQFGSDSEVWWYAGRTIRIVNLKDAVIFKLRWG